MNKKYFSTILEKVYYFVVLLWFITSFLAPLDILPFEIDVVNKLGGSYISKSLRIFFSPFLILLLICAVLAGVYSMFMFIRYIICEAIPESLCSCKDFFLNLLNSKSKSKFIACKAWSLIKGTCILVLLVLLGTIFEFILSMFAGNSIP
jgi:hypothetical protein